jgi:predicted DCC family thiol-disulfide oxidoreductase YuxK
MPAIADPVPAETIVIYDEECFFCSNYIRLLRLKETLGDVRLVNARDAEAAKQFRFTPSELNEGMLLILSGKRYFGADAIHRMTLLSTSSTPFNRLNRLIFRHHALAVLLYPLLKLGRRLYLAISGKGLIP